MNTTDTTNNFLLFMGDHYYPSGGWHDVIGSYGTRKAAIVAAELRESDFNVKWWHVVDISTQKIVARSS